VPARNFFAVSRRLSVTSGGCYSSRTLEPQANEQLLRIELLGGFTVHVAGEGPRQLPARKARALLARLALPAGRPHSRESLTALLWGDNPEELARQAFRQTLSRLRRGLGGPAIAALLDRPDTVALDPGSVWVDAAEFEVAASRDEPTALLRAAALYRGDLLDGLDVDEPGFDEWRTVERERLRELALEALAKLLAHHMRADNLEPAVQTALHLLALDPLQEAVHRALMRLYARQGRRAAAFRQYQECVQSLQRELGAEPEESTRALYRQLLRGASGDPGVLDRFAESSDGGVWLGAGVTRGPLIGRATALEALERSLERALDGGARVALISGEAGIGKTRLLEALGDAAAARGARVLLGRCYETEQPLPFRPWVDVLRGERSSLEPVALASLTAGARAQLARLFAELPPSAESRDIPADDHGALFEAVRELVTCLAADRPLVLALEDVHWADPMSLRLLAFLGRRVRALPVLVVVTAREEDTVEAPMLERALAELRDVALLDAISLAPLSRDDTVILAHAVYRGGDPGLIERVATSLWTLSEGNPFVTVETVRMLRDVADAASLRQVPPSVRETVESRLARVSDAARTIASVAAVIGRTSTFDLLRVASGLSETEAAAAVEELVRRRFLDIAGEALVFCHDRIRQVAYEAVLPPRRLLLHRAVARALESSSPDRLDEVAGDLGHHFLIAGELEPAILYLGRFAEIATRRYAIDAALAALTQAEAAVERLPVSSREHRQLEVALRRAFVLTAAGRHLQCLEVLKANALRQRRVPDPDLAGEYHYRLAMTRFYLGDYADARLAAAAALSDGERTGNRDRIGRALHALALVSTAAGASSEAMDYCERAVRLLDEPSTWRRLASAHWLLGLNLIYTAQFDGALEHLARCVTLADAVGDAKLRSMAEGLESWVHALRGDGRAAMDCAQRALEASRGTIPTSLALRWVGYAYLDEGNARAAIDVLQRACDQIEHFPVRHTYVESLAFLAEAHVLADDAARGLELARRATELAQMEGSPFNVGLAERAAGRAARATGDAPAGEAHLGRALEAFESTGATFEAAMTRLELVRALAARGETSSAQAYLAEAIAALHAARVPRRVAEARALAKSLGLEPRVRGEDSWV
jgi:DNA-binding SARP family transcriptional activator